jgi:hypothetical protein
MPRLKKRADGRYQAKIQTGCDMDGNPVYKFVYVKTEAELDARKNRLDGLQAQEIFQALAWVNGWMNGY